MAKANSFDEIKRRLLTVMGYPQESPSDAQNRVRQQAFYEGNASDPSSSLLHQTVTGPEAVNPGLDVIPKDNKVTDYRDEYIAPLRWRGNIETRAKRIGIEPTDVVTPEGKSYKSLFVFNDGHGYRGNRGKLADMVESIPDHYTHYDEWPDPDDPDYRGARYNSMTKEITTAGRDLPDKGTLLNEEVFHALDDLAADDQQGAVSVLKNGGDILEYLKQHRDKEDQKDFKNVPNISPRMLSQMMTNKAGELDPYLVNKLAGGALTDEEAAVGVDQLYEAARRESFGGTGADVRSEPNDKEYFTDPSEVIAKSLKLYGANPALYKKAYPEAAKALRLMYNDRLKGVMTLSKRDEIASDLSDAYG